MIYPNLEGIKMKVITTDPFGSVNHETIFCFSQTNDIVSAEYSGGSINKGFLVGTLKDDNLCFSYCQLQNDGRLDSGISKCVVTLNTANKILITEHFEWKSRPEITGTNIFLQL